jgi:hypothetical protein
MVQNVKESFLKDMTHSLRITIDGTQEEIKPANGKFFTLKEMYAATGAEMVEFLYLPENKVMVVDEEGWYRNPKINAIATQVLIDALNDVPVPTIVGNVMIIEESELEGEEDEE